MIGEGGRRSAPAPLAGARQAAAACVECGSTSVLIPIGSDDASICLGCVTTLLAGCVPDHVGWGGLRPVYWWWCVCGRQVRDARFTVDLAGLSLGQVGKVEHYREQVAGVPSGGVMLCRRCAEAAGVPLPAPAPARAPANVIEFPRGRTVRHGQ